MISERYIVHDEMLSGEADGRAILPGMNYSPILQNAIANEESKDIDTAQILILIRRFLATVAGV